MSSLSKSLVVYLFICLATGLYSLCWAEKDGGSDLLEQSKQLLATQTGELQDWIEEKTGQYIPLDLEFVDERGQTLQLGEIIDRPTIFLPIYFYCPNICSKNLANLAVALNNLSFTAGKDFRVIALSFSEVENSEVAAKAKRNYLKILDDDFPEDQWWFLTGKKDTIKMATDAVGFKFKKMDDETFIHPAALMVVAADGKIIRYVYGSFLAGDVDMGVSDAMSGRPSLSVKRLLGFCFNYDPDTNKSVFQNVKIAVVAIFGVGLVFIFVYFRRKGHKTQLRP